MSDARRRPFPRLLIGGVSSGVGKTTFTLGLCRALARRGLEVRVFKCGPDYLDPTYHRAASGHAVHNLDSWLMSQAAISSTFVRNAGAVSLIEGVMGLFDGASPTDSTGSSAEISRILGAPVILVCDASGMARSVAALVHGFASFEPGVSLGGIVCNRVGSAGHLELLRRACALSPVSLPPVLGGLIKDAAPRFPERHLGLHSALELELEPSIQAWADQVERSCDVAALLALAESAPALTALDFDREPKPAACRIAVARDAAFHFYYEANLRLLEAAGAELVPFSPLRDESLPDVDGVYIGGGYPELHAQELAANLQLLAQLRQMAAASKPIYAECGGLMYLARTLVTLDGNPHQLVGLIDGTVYMTDRLQALGYVEVETQVPTPLGPSGTRFRGHQFRYSRFEPRAPANAYAMRIARTGAVLQEGHLAPCVLASYVHAHWASNPQIAESFVRACTASRAVSRSPDREMAY
jgi:cobyrinic acid a,c-diamide synthase